MKPKTLPTLTRAARAVFFFAAVCVAPLTGAAATRQKAAPRPVPEGFRFHPGFRSKFLPKPRQIIVHLPPGYAREEGRRYPVLYLLDGESVFASWRIDETARALAESGQIEPLIIVGVPHGGSQQERTAEYTPTHMFGQGGGRGDRLGRMLTEELKPFIDSQYRTLPGASDTALGGVSFGGLISLHIGLKHPSAFGRLAVMSPSVWWGEGVILRSVGALKARPETRIWLDVGTGEGRGMLHDARRLRDALVRKGWALDRDLAYFEDRGAEHTDSAWAGRADRVLKFLFPAAAPAQKEGAGRDARFYERAAREAYEARDYAAYLENMKRAVQMRPEHPRLLYNLAGAYALAGERAEALRLLARVASMGLYYPAERDSDFDSVKDTDEFKAALRRFASSREPTGRSTTAFVIKERGLVTEGIAYDPAERVFYVSSAHRRKILRVDAGGEARDFAGGRDGLLSVMGMKVDAKRRHLWVAANAHKLMSDFDPREDGTSAVYKFDLKTGRLVKRYLLPNTPRKHGFGDLAVHPDGDVYVTDSLTPAVYRIRRDADELELFLESDALASPQGLDFAPDGRRLFLADYSRGLFAVDLASKRLARLEAPPDSSVLGIDGLYFHRGSLVGVQNGTNPHRVVRVALDDRHERIRSVSVVEANNPLFDEPTLGVVVGDTFYYVAASGWGAFDKEGKLAPPEKLKEHVVLKVKL